MFLRIHDNNLRSGIYFRSKEENSILKLSKVGKEDNLEQICQPIDLNGKRKFKTTIRVIIFEKKIPTKIGNHKWFVCGVGLEWSVRVLNMRLKFAVLGLQDPKVKKMVQINFRVKYEIRHLLIIASPYQSDCLYFSSWR